MKLAAIIGLLFVSSSCQPSTADYARLSAQCAEAGLKSYDAYKLRLADRYVSAGLVDPPEFHFSRALGTCLMKVGHWSFIPGPMSPDPRAKNSDLLNEVIDVFTNKTILSGGHENRWTENGDLKTRLIGTDPMEFDAKAESLMIH